MDPFQFQKTQIKGLTLIAPLFIPDSRGCLSKTFEAGQFAAQGIRFSLAEELESKSCRSTLRGLHFQRRHSQDKLVRVLAGEVFDVAVDLRPRSPTFGKWQGFRLSAENRRMLYIPKEFAHGYLVLSEEAVIHYLCGDKYDPVSEDGILWDDPELGIDWPIGKEITPILSQRDQSFQCFSDYCRSIRSGV